MSEGTCSIEECSKPVKARGWCSAHYELWRKHGDPRVNHRWDCTDPEERFSRLWSPGDALGLPECHLWTGHVTYRGYGHFYPGPTSDVHSVIVHRWAYEHFIGSIPEGHEVDHVCHNRDRSCSGGFWCLHRRCVRIEHLEAVPPEENARRSHRAPANRTHCPSGHEYTPENTYLYDGRRFCRACALVRSAAYKRTRRGQP